MTTLSPTPSDFHLPADFAFFSGGPFRRFWHDLRSRLRLPLLEAHKALFGIVGKQFFGELITAVQNRLNTSQDIMAYVCGDKV